METTAHYDKATKEFIINTPTTKAQKYWITNGIFVKFSYIIS
jgi:acyl-CoA oxidase